MRVDAQASTPLRPGREGADPREPRRKRWRINPAYGFIAVSAAALLLFTFWPIVRAIWLSFYEFSFVGSGNEFIGLGNYRRLAADPRFWKALTNTIVYTAAAGGLQVVLALGLAVGVNGEIRGRTFLRAAYFLPAITSFAIMGIVFSFLFSPDIGLFSLVPAKLGLPRIEWLRNPDTAMAAVIIVGIWKTTGFNMVILLAALQDIPEYLYEAASIDGATPLQKFWHITVPSLRQALLFVTVITVIASLQVFDQVFVMTDGGPLFATETLVTYLHQQGFERFQMGYASALSVVLFALILVVAAVQLRLFRYRDVH